MGRMHIQSSDFAIDNYAYIEDKDGVELKDNCRWSFNNDYLLVDCVIIATEKEIR